jgi:hypothetical protein
MFPFSSRPYFHRSIWSTLFTAILSAPAIAVPSFQSIDNRLPNPDRPYDMTSGTVNFFSGPTFGLYDLQLVPRKPSQLDIPKPNTAGNWEFNSVYDVIYQAMVSTGLEPVHRVSGYGTAHVVGVGTNDMFHQVFDTELVSLDLVGLSHYPQFQFRESPTLRSSGITTRDDLCPPCATAFTRWQISSFIDAFAEVSFDGGASWTPGNQPFHIEQPADPMKLGDFNGDGKVDGADYVTWRRGNGTMYRMSDYDLWRAQFGVATTTGGGTGTPSAIPEPAASCLLALAVAAAFRYRKRRRH